MSAIFFRNKTVIGNLREYLGRLLFFNCLVHFIINTIPDHTEDVTNKVRPFHNKVTNQGVSERNSSNSIKLKGD